MQLLASTCGAKLMLVPRKTHVEFAPLLISEVEDGPGIRANHRVSERGIVISSIAPNARNVAFCASVNPLIPVILSRS